MLCVAKLTDTSFVSGRHDQTLKLWNVEDGNVIRTFEGHTDAVRLMEMAMLSLLSVSAVTDILYSFACLSTSYRYTGCKVFKISKKYWRGGPLPTGYLSGKYFVKSGSLLNYGHSFFTESSS